MKTEGKLGTLDSRRYDWSKATRGRFAKLKLPAEAAGVRILDADLEAAFPDSDSVNAALRALVRVAEATKMKKVKPRKNPSRAA
jgi:hypothetical protein